MGVTFIDTETSFQILPNGDKDPMWHNPKNFLVSCGWAHDDLDVEYVFTQHNERRDEDAKERIQTALDNTELLVAHNMKFDLGWLRSSGFVYEGKIWDTMLVEYILARSRHTDLSLAGSAIRRRVEEKDDGVKPYIDAGVSFEAIPLDIVLKYGRQDVETLRQLYYAQLQILEV